MCYKIVTFSSNCFMFQCICSKNYQYNLLTTNILIYCIVIVPRPSVLCAITLQIYVTEFWSVVNEVARRPAAKEPFPIQAFALQGEPVTINFIKDISQSFNSYLSSVGLQLTEALTPSGPTEVEDTKYATVAVFELRPKSLMLLVASKGVQYQVRT